MKALTASLALAAILATSGANAASGGQIGTLERGHYICEMPGDAATMRGIPVPEENFEIRNASRYRTAEGDGTYLRTGDSVALTSGPRQGDRYIVRSERFVRKLDADGRETGLRCIKAGSTRD